MAAHTSHYHSYMRGIASRRKTFLLRDGGRDLIYPARGEIWEPSDAHAAMCDAFILFAVSELEAYFEGILRDGIDVYERMLLGSVLKKCGAIKDFGEKFTKKKSELSKNNNANWIRISHFFDFVGFAKEVHFPADFWDDVDVVVKHRGDVAHNGVSLKIVEDRRNIILRIEEVTRKIRSFDVQFQAWIISMQSEVTRLGSFSLSFQPTF
ncbi:hypothetical protein [Limimaricola cinnabarinus]|uniref:hypothetical protein n=1 Tax=Limimaricola cinnabarinus TaxID=1125964 RepID=UPI0024924162|nr:hypothetical protein [Limimaricola cinnabarinus]